MELVRFLIDEKFTLLEKKVELILQILSVQFRV